MSLLSDAFENIAKTYGFKKSNFYSLGGHVDNNISDFINNEIVNKADLRGSQLEAVLSGMPVVGNVLRGVEGANQLEDLYNRTGKTVQYPAIQNMGMSSLGHLANDISKKIEGGTHDLAEFYSGDREINNVFDSVNGYSGRHPVHYADSNIWRKII